MRLNANAGLVSDAASPDVSFESGGYRLAGTLTDAAGPGGAGPVAAALVLQGSGKTDRNSDSRLPGGQTLRGGVTRAVAEALTRAGVSTLRYDKRGVGASEGDILRVGMDDRRADAHAALAWLADRVPGVPLLAVGHSEGAFYAAELAADGAVAGAVLLSAGARPGEDILTWQTAEITARLPTLTSGILRLLHIDVIGSQRKRVAKIKAAQGDVIRIQGFRFNARWFRDFLAYDPVPVLARIPVPVLAITGGQDVQVPPDDVAAIGRLVRGPFEGHVVGDLSHLLRPDPGSVGPRGYRRAARQPVSPEVLDLINAWVAQHWAGQHGGSQHGVSQPSVVRSPDDR